MLGQFKSLRILNIRRGIPLCCIMFVCTVGELHDERTLHDVILFGDETFRRRKHDYKPAQELVRLQQQTTRFFQCICEDLVGMRIIFQSKLCQNVVLELQEKARIMTFTWPLMNVP